LKHSVIIFLLSVFSTNALSQEQQESSYAATVQPAEQMQTTEANQEQVTTESDVVTAENDSPETAEQWLSKLKTALMVTHFDAGVVTTKANKTDSYKWLHGVVEGQEVESIAPLIGGGVTTIRKGNTVAFIETNKQIYSIEAPSIRRFIPPVFYKDVSVLKDSYQFVLVSKNQIGGRPAKLIRIESKNNSTFNYWVWVDIESGLPLRMEYVNAKGEVIERMLMTHLSIYSAPTEDMMEVAKLDLPIPATVGIASNRDTNDWQIAYLPQGFELVKSDRHHVSMSREVSDYYLFSDGLVEFSVYIQRPLESFKSPIVLHEGVTSFVMINANGFDVTVVGSIPAETAYQIASNIKRH